MPHCRHTCAQHWYCWQQKLSATLPDATILLQWLWYHIQISVTFTHYNCSISMQYNQKIVSHCKGCSLPKIPRLNLMLIMLIISFTFWVILLTDKLSKLYSCYSTAHIQHSQPQTVEYQCNEVKAYSEAWRRCTEDFLAAVTGMLN